MRDATCKPTPEEAVDLKIVVRPATIKFVGDSRFISGQQKVGRLLRPPTRDGHASDLMRQTTKQNPVMYRGVEC